MSEINNINLDYNYVGEIMIFCYFSFDNGYTFFILNSFKNYYFLYKSLPLFFSFDKSK